MLKKGGHINQRTRCGELKRDREREGERDRERGV